MGGDVWCLSNEMTNAGCYRNMCGTVMAGHYTPIVVIPEGHVVRRLSPEELELLQGFSPEWTKVRYNGKPADKCPSGPRREAIGNSFSVPVVRWIGERICAWETLEP